MEMPGRQYNATTGYRYGFNGKEKDTESPVQYDYGFRIYDPRLVRFKSVDPLTKGYPMLTPYQFAENQLIWAIDLDGLEKYIVIHYKNKYNQVYKTVLRGIREIDTKEPIDLQLKNVHGALLTTKDVYETSYHDNKKINDIGGRNSTKTEEIAARKARSPKVKYTEGSSDLPYENNIDETYQFEEGKYTSVTKDGDKFEYFEDIVMHHIEEPTKKSFYNDLLDIVSGNLNSNKEISIDRSSFGIKRHAKLIIDNQINLAVTQFKQENTNLKTVLIDGITITTNPETLSHMRNVAKEIQKKLGVKVKIKTDPNFIANNRVNGLGAYGVTTNVSGVK